MPFDPSGVFTRLYNWVTDRDNSIAINAPRMDAETDGIVAGINSIVNQAQKFIAPLKVVAGTVTAPAVAPDGDANTGPYFPASDQFAVALGGAQAMLMTSTALTLAPRILGPVGALAEPAFSSSAYPSTGAFFTSVGMVFTALGQQTANFNTTNCYISKPLAGPGAVRTSLAALTVGGTANAITLSCFGDPAIVIGTEVRFSATVANTGPVTINLDGRGPEVCSTVSFLPLPAGYIRTDAVTVATYNGSGWTVDRAPERATNANGTYTRYADGSATFYATRTEVRAASGTLTTTVTLPLTLQAGWRAQISLVASAATAGATSWWAVDSHTPTTVNAVIIRSNAVNTAFNISGEGSWY